MALTIKIENPDEISKETAAKRKKVVELKEGIQDSLRNVEEDLNGGLDTELAEGRLSPEEYELHKGTNEQMLENYTNALKAAGNTITRYDQLLSENSGLCIIIPASTGRDELKQIIQGIEALLKENKNAEEVEFFNAILARTKNLKDIVDTGKAIKETNIPITRSELVVWERIAKDLGQDNSQAKDLNYLNSQVSAVHSSKTLRGEEKNILIDLYNKLSSILLSDSTDKHSKIQQAVSDVADTSASIKRTEGFRGFLNAVCQFFKLPLVFTMKSESVASTISIKQELQLFKKAQVADDSPEVEFDHDQQGDEAPTISYSS
ncbi:hypothetical protein [Legionella sp. 16cNR16C]|uniref:hypothetical protein n=1 Tax=Legionella sp. 16cNR16C TaxID=2905656 RepID=UPI001E3CCAA4|nr:hypothetical protein [Legionella sp. 16cNR16C]MCE3046016.1 hypothetical protein [Legionella sp. 16cNR16C]